ncbi:MAG: chemotaxis protein CheW [Myxococcota bacterium]
MSAPGMNGGNGSWDDLARQAGDAEGGAAPADALRQLLAFDVGEAVYAVPVESVREIVRIRPITPMPRVSDDVRGVIALRGEVVQVVDLRRRLGLPPVEPSRTSRIVVVHQDDGRVSGVLVDAVREVLRVPADAIGPPAGGESVAVEALCSHGEEFVSLIALDRVLQVDGES